VITAEGAAGSRWRQNVQARAKVRIEIEDALDNLPRAYGKELYETKCATLFEHVYEAYRGDGGSVFSDAAA